jgi:heme oxygenase
LRKGLVIKSFEEPRLATGDDLRTRLRLATSDVHERLHRHPGLGAVANGSITRGDYGRLLLRLWGFHHSFESVLRDAARDRQIGLDLDARARAVLLEQDLSTLGFDRRSIQRTARCEYLYPPRNEAELLGALYVVEGSTLGGVQLARAIAPIFNSEGDDGRRFFLGYGARNGEMWRAFLKQLDRYSGDVESENLVTKAAVKSFADFETWMGGWLAAPDARGL